MNPICFHIGTHPVYWYGVMMAVAFLAAIGHWVWLARRCGRPPDYGYDIAFVLMFSGIIGARINYVLANWQDFISAPLNIIRIDQGGLIYYGGFIGAVLAAVILARRRRENLWWFSDFVITALPLGHFFGRIGCFLNGCCYGVPCSRAWCTAPDGIHRFPIQLCEAGWNLFIYVILTAFFLRRGRVGRVFCLYLLLYPSGRFLLEFWRDDQRQSFSGMHTAQWVSLLLIAAGVGLWVWLARRRR